MKTKGPIAEFLLREYLRWQSETGQKQTIGAFADYIGVSRATLDKWMNGTRSPGKEHAAQLAQKLDPEIYDLLGLQRPDPALVRLASIFNGLPPEQQRAFMRLAEGFDREHGKGKTADASKSDAPA